MYNFLLICLIFFSLISFHLGFYFPIGLSVFIFLLLIIKNISLFKKNKIGLMSLVFFLIYSLPFIHLLEYIWTDVVNDAPILMWGLLTRESMLDNKVVSLTGMIGCSGALAISIAFRIKKLTFNYFIAHGINTKDSFKSVKLRNWLLFLLLGVVLSNLTTPKDNILISGYGESTSVLYDSNFSSSWMLSYSILTFLFVDSLLETNYFIKEIKWKLILVSIFYILIFNQLLRGDRDALPWIISLLMIYFFWKDKYSAINYEKKLPSSKFLFLFIVLFFASFLIGIMRNSVAGFTTFDDFFSFIVENKQVISSNILHGTWSAVLLTPLSLANDYIYNSLQFNLGRDYIDLLLSSPPGFMADLIGYSRPWDINPDPAMKLVSSETSTGGGIHLSAMAFWNFSFIGVIIFGFIWGYMIKGIESFSISKKPFLGMTLIGICSLALPHAVWYGEKNFLNALIIWFGLYKLFSHERKNYVKNGR